MKDYRSFLNENGSNTYIDIIQWLAENGYNDRISSEDSSKTYYVQEETTTTITLILYAESPKDRPNLKNSITSFLDSLNIPYEHTSKGGSMGRTEISSKFTGDKNIWIQYKYSSSGIDVQELLVAALVLNGETYGANISLDECNNILDSAAKSLNQVVGVSDRAKYIEQLSKNYLDLAPSISSSNSILQLLKSDGQTISTAYWTGKTWDKEISFLNPPIGKTKNYNSSDIIFKTEGIQGTVFYGFSLKKKKKSGDADPTLINKTITGERSFLIDIVPQNEIDEIEEAKYEFFRMVVQKELGISSSVVRKMSFDEVKKNISSLSNETVSNYLKSKNNIFFKKIDEILPKYSKSFTKEFLDEVFKTKLSENLETKDFKFNLNTGIGRVDKTNIIIEPAENKDLVSTIEVLTDIFQSELSVRQTPGKLQAWNERAGAAKIFYTIFSDDIDIINIEIRYKGSFTAEPQFQAVARPNFKNLFK